MNFPGYNPMGQFFTFARALYTATSQNNPLAKAHRPFSPRLFFEVENDPNKPKNNCIKT